MPIAAIRYNNPGNVSLPIRGYNGPGEIVGIRGQPGYASFPTIQDGLRAQQARLTSYIERGVGGSGPLTTIAQMNTRYAEDPNWGRGVSRNSGIGLHEPLDPSNSNQMSRLQGGIIRQETGMSPERFGLGANGAGLNSDAAQASGAGLSPPGTAGGLSGYEGRVGSEITSLGPTNASGQAEVTLGFPGDTPGVGSGTGAAQIGGFDSTGGFTGTNVSSGSQTGAFGLGGVMSGGSAVGSGGAPLSLDGATLDSGVSAGSVTGGADNIAGYNAAGPVQANPALVGAVNAQGEAATKAIKEGDKKIGDDVKTAGQTIGQSITSSVQSALNWASDSFLRLAFIVTGLVLFAAALWYFARPQVEAVAGKVADVAGALPIPAAKALSVARKLA